MMASPEPIVLVLLGDGWIGKSALLEKLSTGNFSGVSRDVGCELILFFTSTKTTKC